MHTLSDEGLRLLCGDEAFRANAYLDQAGIATIGFGSIRLNGEPVALGMTINLPVAQALLRGDARKAAEAINRWITAPLTQAQFDALVSLVYNIGIGGFQTSTLRRVINAGLPVQADHFTRWNKVRDPNTGEHVVSNGLTARREREYARFAGESA
jgi:lysozyme